MLQQAATRQPRPSGHFLTPSELAGVSSVACLEAKQRDPAARCENVTGSGEQEVSSNLPGRATAVNYPNYRDAACRSRGEPLCDPGPRGAMNATQRAELARELRELREGSPVTCGRLLNDPVDPRHLQPFYLGVAVLPDWPTVDSDPESLQQLGQIIEADWNMDELYVGRPQPYLRCPNTAMLLILPGSGQAFLSSGSCEFICASRGGAEVAAKARAALRSGGRSAYGAALAGVGEAYAFLAQHGPAGEGEVAPVAVEPTGTREFYLSTLAQRALFVVAVVSLGGSLALGLAVLLLGPGLISHRGKWGSPA